MKKIALAAVAAVVATLSLSSAADAGTNWRHRGFNHNGWNHGWNHNGWNRHGWRHNHWGWNHGWRYGWRAGYWGGPTIVVAPGYSDYCFVKKVRHYDDNGNLHIKRVRVCR
jgi:hypothetical protein